VLGSHRARRRFGQHFLVDESVLGAMVSLIAPHAHDLMLEIGPGQGALTSLLMERSPSLVAVEIDRDLIAALRARFPALTLVEGDALRIDLASLAGQVMADVPDAGALRWRVVGNLPYNISTPLLVRLLAQTERLVDMHFLLQHEVVARLAAVPGTKDWGRLSVLMQYHCNVQPLLDVSPSCFKPAPKVESTFVRLTPRRMREALLDHDVFEAVLRAGFQQRRKTLRNALREFAIDWGGVPLSATLRPDQVDVAGYVALANLVARHGKPDVPLA
jgi:16S rRNA (adenine1518-N6/adenine1519-N6)-dimethyltransferase